PPEARSAWLSLSSRTTCCPAANLNGTPSATRTGRQAARTSGADASVAETCSFQPCSGDRAPAGETKAQGPSTENLHPSPAGSRARAATQRSSVTARSRGATSMDGGFASCGESRGEPGEFPSCPPARDPSRAERPRRAQTFYAAPRDSCSKRPEGNQAKLIDEYRISFFQRWVASILRIVPDFDRMTSDCVLAPSPRNRTPRSSSPSVIPVAAKKTSSPATRSSRVSTWSRS